MALLKCTPYQKWAKMVPKIHQNYTKSVAPKDPNAQTKDVLAVSRLTFFTGVGGMSEATRVAAPRQRLQGVLNL